MTAKDIIENDWDAIVIGTGMGGATFGFSFAMAGKRVLFCEKGYSFLNAQLGLRGAYAESFFTRLEYPQVKHREFLARAGRYFEEIEDITEKKTRKFIPFIGAGIGGSTSLFGMALERFFPLDFTPKRHFENVTETNLPEHWPIAYKELAPFYEVAEKLFRIRGTADPLKDESQISKQILSPPPLSRHNEEIFDFFLNKGLHPYRLPLACEFVDSCQGCQGYLCDFACKNDCVRVCLEPAVNQFGAKLIDNCEVIKLECEGDRVSTIVCRHADREVRINCQSAEVVLAAGALSTPTILFKSASKEWPKGLANESGFVGKNLMRHCIDLYAVAPGITEQINGNVKEIAFNDFYQIEGQKLGSVQSFGTLPPTPILVDSIENDLRHAFPLPVSLGFNWVKPTVKNKLDKLFKSRIILATTMEDLPYLDNRIRLSKNDGRVTFEYRIHHDENRRIQLFRKYMKDALSPYRYKLLKQAENNERIAHACGTCRFGNDPETSVLDSTNRCHSVSNLYVVDSSFFPSSSGTNPGLTIAANALRVADYLLTNR